MDLTKLFADLKKHLDEDDRVSSTRTAILWGREDLFGDAVKTLLTSLGDWRVIRIFDEQGIETLTREVERSNPALVIVNQENAASDIQPLLRLIRGCPELRIIAINPADNLVDVYDKHMFRIREIADLLSIIEEPSKSQLEGGEG